MRKSMLCFVGAVSFASVIGCSSSRDVEVSGEVSAPVGTQGEVLVEFFDLSGEERTSVHSIRLSGPGAFAETISVEGESIAIRAIADSDADSACTAGEAWAEAEAAIAEDDTVEPVTLSLSAAECPAD